MLPLTAALVLALIHADEPRQSAALDGSPPGLKTAVSTASPAASIPAASMAAADAAENRPDYQTLLLNVVINGNAIGKIGEFTLSRGKLMVRPAELTDLGLRLPGLHNPGQDGLIGLSDIARLTWSLDRQRQELNITAPNDILQPTLLAQPLEPEGPRAIETGTGMTVNYDVIGSFAGMQKNIAGFLDIRAFSPYGVLSSSWIANYGLDRLSKVNRTETRLDSAYSFADVNSMRRYTLGDFVTSGLSWSRPIRLGGAQVLSDFSTRPDLVTFPLPSVSGSAAVPSTVTVLTDGNLQVSAPIGAGPFQIPQLPVVTGAGTISMTVTNALGQQVQVTQPFYASSALLAPGLQTSGLQAGLVRRNWGLLSNDYGRMAAAGVYRRGLTSRLTVESSLEGASGLLMGGAGGVAQIGTLGVVNFSAAASSNEGGSAASFPSAPSASEEHSAWAAPPLSPTATSAIWPR